MGKFLWFGLAPVIVASVYWHCYSSKSSVETRSQPARVLEQTKHGTQSTNPTIEIAPCDTFEPLVVEGSPLPQVPQMDPATDEEPATRVVMAPDMRLPPRPDAEPGKVLRMPYADEEEDVDSTNAVRDLMETLLSRFNILENGEDRNPAEESEPKDVTPPMQKSEPESNPESNPAMDYHHHHQHCPYSGAYSNPYRRW